MKITVYMEDSKLSGGEPFISVARTGWTGEIGKKRWMRSEEATIDVRNRSTECPVVAASRTRSPGVDLGRSMIL